MHIYQNFSCICKVGRYRHSIPNTAAGNDHREKCFLKIAYFLIRVEEFIYSDCLALKDLVRDIRPERDLEGTR